MPGVFAVSRTFLRDERIAARLSTCQVFNEGLLLEVDVWLRSGDNESMRQALREATGLQHSPSQGGGPQLRVFLGEGRKEISFVTEGDDNGPRLVIWRAAGVSGHIRINCWLSPRSDEDVVVSLAWPEWSTQEGTVTVAGDVIDTALRDVVELWPDEPRAIHMLM
jgi:hypothetical protein